ncbi:MAG: TonB-dependent receptor [Steroidobacter sp.]
MGTNFTRVLLNGAPVAVASTGRTDNQNTNREVDLDLFPTELFTQLTVKKSSDASLIEGGAAGTVNMRSARPFDNPGEHLTYSVQLTKTGDAGVGEHGSLMVSDTWGDFGALVGIVAARNKVDVKGFETIGWTNPTLNAAQLGANTASPYAGNGWGIPANVPVGTGGGLTDGALIDNTFLINANPGLAFPGATNAQITQELDNAMLPRLGRNANEYGNKDRYNAVLSLQYNPSDSMQFYLDSLYGKKKNVMQRIDMDWAVRFGSQIPVNETVDRTDCSNGCVVTSGTFPNSSFFLEYRPYTEDVKFWGVNPGFEWKINDLFKVDLQGNKTNSTFHRESPSVLVSTFPGVIVNYVNNGDIPTIGSNVDLNNPANFGWNGGSRVNIQDEKRETNTKGVRGNLTFGHDTLNLKVGAAYDDTDRTIRALDNSQAWQNAVCGGNPNLFLPGPNTEPPCQGLTGTQITAGLNGYPNYPALGTNYTATGYPSSLIYQGSLIPQASVPGYLLPGPDGFVTVDWNKFKAATNYDAFHASEVNAASSNTNGNQGYVDEKVTSVFAQLNGDTTLGGNRLRYDVGVRWVKTKQTIGGYTSFSDPRNTPAAPAPAIGDGGRYPNINNFDARTEHTYSNTLPSFELAYNASENTVIRASASKTMTRPDPSAMLPGINYGDPSGQTASIGNSALQPYISENLDLGVEVYTGHEGYIGFDGFRKRLTGFTVTGITPTPFSALAVYGITLDTVNSTQRTAIQNQPGGANSLIVAVSQQVNAPGSLTINGLELNWVQPLDFLLEGIGLKGFGFTANYTIIDQAASGITAAAFNQVALGVPPHAYNLTFYYDNHGVSARVSEVFNAANQVGAYLQNGIGPSTSQNGGLYNDNYRQWDFSSSFDLKKLFGLSWEPEVTVDAANLFNAEQRQYFQFTNAAFTVYKPGRQYMIGIRQKF